MLPDVDRRALKILIDMHWSASGWREEHEFSASPKDFAYAQRAGYVFDDVRLSHGDIVKRVFKSISGIDRRIVADAFVASLTTRRLEIRSALGSFAVLQHFPNHRATNRREPCPICGAYMGPPMVQNLSVLNFERFKWGGVRHDGPLYASFDMTLFRKLHRITPTPDDVDSLQSILRAIDKAPAKTTSAALEKRLAKCFNSSKAEREVVIGIFGYCGILETKNHRGYRKKFIHAANCDIPDRHWVELPYPVCWWRRSDGINYEAVDYWFGHLLGPTS